MSMLQFTTNPTDNLANNDFTAFKTSQQQERQIQYDKNFTHNTIDQNVKLRENLTKSELVHLENRQVDEISLRKQERDLKEYETNVGKCCQLCCIIVCLWFQVAILVGFALLKQHYSDEETDNNDTAANHIVSANTTV